MTVVEALQQWLALEHEAVWTYPVIGARVSSLEDRARTSFAAHRATRDLLVGRLVDLGADPVATRIAYAGASLRTEAQAERAARGLERRIAAACLTLAGDSEGRTRAYAVRGLTKAARAELAWGAGPRAFPGLD